MNTKTRMASEDSLQIIIGMAPDTQFPATDPSFGIGGNQMISPKDQAEELGNVAEQIKEAIETGKFSWDEFQQMLAEKTQEAVGAVDDFVHESPWIAAGIGAGLGVAAGMLIARRDEILPRSEEPKYEQPETERQTNNWELAQSTVLFLISAIKAVQAFRDIRR